MEIIVQGKGNEFFAPDEIIFNIDFIKKGQSYEEVLKEGSNNVQYFIDELLLKNGFQKEDLKTRSFTISEERRYDNLTHQSVFDGFSFSQKAILRFDYDKSILARMMTAISKLEDAPVCQVQFGIKNEKECRKVILSKAYKNAEDQAFAIAQAANKTLTRCMKVDFKPFTTDYYSQVNFGTDMMYAERACFGAADTIINTFTPTDIELTETLYCLWLAE